MWVLLAAIFVAILVALYILQGLNNTQTQAGVRAGTDETRVAAMQAVQLMQACMQQAPGTYTQSALGGSGYPAATPAGNAWVCQVTAGGSLTTGNSAALYLDGPPKMWALAGLNGKSGTASSTVQMNFATQVAAVAAQQMAGQSDVSVGVIDAGDSTPILHIAQPAPQDVSLAGDVPAAPLSYTTAALAAGVSKTGF